MAEHGIDLTTTGCAFFTDAAPRVRLGEWFYATANPGTWTCTGGRVFVPASAGAAIGAKLKISVFKRSGLGQPAGSADINFGSPLATATVSPVAAGWNVVHWSPVSFTNAPATYLFISYEFLSSSDAFTGWYVFSSLGTGSARPAATLPGMVLAESAFRSEFAQGAAESLTSVAASNSASWYGVEPLIEDQVSLVRRGGADFPYSLDVGVLGHRRSAGVVDVLANFDIGVQGFSGGLGSTGSPINLRISPYARDFIRDKATELMNSTCRVFTPDLSTHYDEATGRVTSGEGTTKYEGPCRIWEVAAGQQIVVGGEEISMSQTYLSLPWSIFPLPETDDMITVVDSDDPDLVGRSLSIMSTVRGGGLRASRRFLVDVSSSTKGTW